ncbi:MAG: coproporphyrinogen III oxidase family protein, partial [Desulfurobacteriaceae bacterium]
ETLLKHFSNVSVDLMYGIPEQSVEDFLKDIETVTSFPIKHISIYALTIYEGTPFYRKLLKGEIRLPEEEKLEKFYYEAVSLLESKGFFQYEISNFAKKGFECKHNLSYWRIENYLGVGPSAASLIAGKYWKNVADLKEYIEIVQREERPTAEEVKLSGKDLLEVKLLMGLRLTEGVKLEEELEKLLKKDKILSLLEEGFLEVEEGRLRLGKKGLFVSNTVIAEVISAIE